MRPWYDRPRHAFKVLASRSDLELRVYESRGRVAVIPVVVQRDGLILRAPAWEGRSVRLALAFCAGYVTAAQQPVEVPR